MRRRAITVLDRMRALSREMRRWPKWLRDAVCRPRPEEPPRP